MGLHPGHCQVDLYKFIFFKLFFSAYTANLAAVLTVSRPHIPIRNIDDLANQSDISYGTINGGSTMQFFQVTFNSFGIIILPGIEDPGTCKNVGPNASNSECFCAEQSGRR